MTKLLFNRGYAVIVSLLAAMSMLASMGLTAGCVCGSEEAQSSSIPPNMHHLVCKNLAGNGDVHSGNAGTDDAVAFLDDSMDRAMDEFYVYDDWLSGGNHFVPSGYMGAIATLGIQENCTVRPQSGNSCIRASFTLRADDWAGVYWLSVPDNWGQEPSAYDLSGSSRITFWARGENGGEEIEFFAGGIEGQYPDSMGKTSTGYVSLDREWRQYAIDLQGLDLEHVNGGFGWVADVRHNPDAGEGLVFYLDKIYYQHDISEKPRFMASYDVDEAAQANRDVLQNAAFTYDNSLALLAYLARGGDEDMKRAEQLAEALVFAHENDPYYHDGRLRNAYMAGELRDAVTGKARLPGWMENGLWRQDQSQVGSSTGNTAWAILALAEYYEKAGGQQYLATMQELGDWIYFNTFDSHGAGGYTGGFEGFDSQAVPVLWKSTEHNLDVYAAFMRLYEITGDPRWTERAGHALSFVRSMYNTEGGFYWTGTASDGQTINKTNVPVDVQAWSQLALPAGERHPEALAWAEKNCALQCDGYSGVDFNNDRDGIWPEGGGMMAMAYKQNNQPALAARYLEELNRMQENESPNGQGIVAACHDGVSTGFTWDYYKMRHVSATSWFVLASLGVNPFTGEELCFIKMF